MPKTKKVNKLTKPKLEGIVCVKCGKEKRSVEFYISYNKLHDGTGKLPYCKNCIQNMCLDNKGRLQIELVKDMLKTIDRPYLHDLYITSFNTSKINPVGIYMKNLALKDYREKTWEDSFFENGTSTNIMNRNNEERSYTISTKSIEITDTMIEMFGAGYTDEEYIAMQKKYLFLRNNYGDKTNLHIEALVTYIRFKVKEEILTANGKVTEAEKWAKMATVAAEKAKINPSQLSKSDLTGGLNSFGELIKAVEQAVDVIPILPQFKYRPNDSLDFIIWCYINYARDLRGMPQCNYEDVYKFYDRKKAEYLEQYGDPYNIFKGDTTEGNREVISKFVTNPEKNIAGDDNNG